MSCRVYIILLNVVKLRIGYQNALNSQKQNKSHDRALLGILNLFRVCKVKEATITVHQRLDIC